MVNLAPTIADVNCVPTEVTVVPEVLTVEDGVNQATVWYRIVPSCTANAPPFCNILPDTDKEPVNDDEPLTCNLSVPFEPVVPRSKLPYSAVVVVEELPKTVVFEPKPVVW